MTLRLKRYALRAILAIIVLSLGLLTPIAYIETMCRGSEVKSDFVATIPTKHHRSEARTYLTYPEWHIVHAYDDYAKVIKSADPHDYQYLKGIAGFWTSLCALSKKSAAHGGFDWETKQTIYTIGTSFTAELLFKGMYEETIGRIATWIRGNNHSALDILSATLAEDYAKFLQQVPWYRWDFNRDKKQLSAGSKGSFRDRERLFALGIEFVVKASYATVINKAVANIGPDALTLRMLVSGMNEEALNGIEGIVVISTTPIGIEIETPRYRVLTNLLERMAIEGANFIEIAGNDDIMLTAISIAPYSKSLFSFSRQGYSDQRHLVSMRVSELAAWIRQNEKSDLRLEHIHDY